MAQRAVRVRNAVSSAGAGEGLTGFGLIWHASSCRGPRPLHSLTHTHTHTARCRHTCYSLAFTPCLSSNLLLLTGWLFNRWSVALNTFLPSFQPSARFPTAYRCPPSRREDLQMRRFFVCLWVSLSLSQGFISELLYCVVYYVCLSCPLTSVPSIPCRSKAVKFMRFW